MLKKLKFLVLFCCFLSKLSGQGFPWQRPLKFAFSADGITFSTPAIFQDSSGVPSVVEWKGDTLICVFQWFRAPVGSLTWDEVAAKFSYDNGSSWTQPTPIIINGIPFNYQRPFDPTLLVLNNDSLRLYFSSSDGVPLGGLDSTVNTYSAVSIDGINYTFEPGARVDVDTNRVIDPAVIYFNNTFHYASPVGSPQQGAYHYLSPDGLNFSPVAPINSDNMHNWTGNYMINDTNDLRFYGAGPAGIWYNSTPNGGVWSGYVNTNLQGGDPSALKLSVNNYLIIYVGQPYTTGISSFIQEAVEVKLYPNPSTNNYIYLDVNESLLGSKFKIFDHGGRAVFQGIITDETIYFNLDKFKSGIYTLSIEENFKISFHVIKN